MEKYIAQYSYFLGLACVAAALLRRALSALGIWLPSRLAEGTVMWRASLLSFYKGALMLLVLVVATVSYAWLKGQKS